MEVRRLREFRRYVFGFFIMGKVMVKDVILRNHKDENLYEAGVITQIRETKADMIADTGAMLVGLSTPIIQKLGLPKFKEANAILADGSQVKKVIYNDLTVRIWIVKELLNVWIMEKMLRFCLDRLSLKI